MLPLRDVKANGIYKETTTEQKPTEMQPKYFPAFMIAISVIQVKKKFFLVRKNWFSSTFIDTNIQVGLMYFLNKYNNDNPKLQLGYDPHRRYQVWRFLTMMFVHTR